jgi:hypothetical protein
VLGHELVHEADAAAVVLPGIELAGIERERHCRGGGEGRILADIVVGRRVSHLDRPRADGVSSLEGSDNFARRERLDLELALSRFGHELRQEVGATIDGVEGLREARGQAPADFGIGLGDGRLCNGTGSEAGASGCEKIAAFHKCLLQFEGMSRFIGRLGNKGWTALSKVRRKAEVA